MNSFRKVAALHFVEELPKIVHRLMTPKVFIKHMTSICLLVNISLIERFKPLMKSLLKVAVVHFVEELPKIVPRWAVHEPDRKYIFVKEKISRRAPHHNQVTTAYNDKLERCKKVQFTLNNCLS